MVDYKSLCMLANIYNMHRVLHYPAVVHDVGVVLEAAESIETQKMTNA